jgi:quinol monooxygenase YgiN
MAFIQIVEFETTNLDALRSIQERWIDATEGKRTARRSILCRDHSAPDRHVLIVFFDSYESALENSNLSETRQLADELSSLLAGPQQFKDLDVVEDRSL